MMKKLLTFFLLLAMAIPLWASEHTVTINRGEGLYQNGSGVYYCVKDGIMMTFTDGLNNENYLIERNNMLFEVNSYNYLIKKIVFYCADDALYGDNDSFYWGPTTISIYQNFYNQSAPGTYQVLSDGLTGVWTGTTNHIQFSTEGHPVRFGKVEIVYDKLDGDIFDLVTNNSQIVDGKTYIIVSRYDDKVMASKLVDDTSFPVTDIVEWMNSEKTKVKVDGKACLFRMENLKDSTIGSSTRKVAWFNTLNGYIRIDNGGDGKNLTLVNNLTSGNANYARAIMYISSTENNYLGWFKSGNCNSTNTIRYDYTNHLIKIKNINNDSQGRVWLYKLAESYNVTTVCDPNGGGTVTLGAGVVENKSQQGETVNFSAEPAAGYLLSGVTVTYTDGSTATIEVTDNGDGTYSFIMPAADVTITAAFDEIAQYNITTQCDPWDGGYISVYDGVTNVDGVISTTNGTTVTFWVGTNWGWHINQVTLVNTATGDPVALNTIETTDAGNRYSFVMPAGNVHILSTFYQSVPDLYLLGTHMGRTHWTPSGPKFTYDPTAEEYYIDVYYKGGVYDQAPTPEIQAYGYFSLATNVDLGIDWRTATPSMGNWDLVYGRLSAEYNNYGVQDGSTDVVLYGDRPGNAFKIPAGIYRIIVNKQMNRMRIVETKGHLYFDPAGGVVNPGQVVTLSSDLQDLVADVAAIHGVTDNGQSFTHSLDNWENTVYTNTTVINDVGTTTVWGRANEGYIEVTGQAEYTILPPTYDILALWTPEAGGSVTVAQSAEGGETVTFTVQTNAHYELTSLTVNSNSDAQPISYTDNGDGTYSFTMPDDGVVIMANFSLVVYNVTTVSNPPAGGLINCDASTALDGETVTFTVSPNTGYDLTSVSLIVGNETTTLTPDQSGVYSFVMPEADVTIMADFSQIQYYINTVCNPPAGGSITCDASNAAYGETVDFTVTPNAGYDLTSVTLTAGGQTTTLTPDQNGTYSFVMPNGDVTVTANFLLNQYSITTVSNPPAGGDINCDAFTAIYGETVTFTVTTNEDYVLSSVTLTVDGQTTTLTPDGNGVYSFVMPEADVTVTADFLQIHDITTVCNPPAGGSINCDASTALVGETVDFTVTPNAGYGLTSVTLTVGNETTTLTPDGNGAYSFVMPDDDVTITADFLLTQHSITTVSNPPAGGDIHCDASTATYGETVTFTVTINEDYILSSVTLTVDGQTTTLTPDENGVYSFVMPDADVTVTANFGERGDLYLLGTENGKTAWAPNGPKFVYDPENDVYTLTVYYKGIRDEAGMEDDHYGHFNMTTVIHESDFDYIEPYRLVPNMNSVHPIVTPNHTYPLRQTGVGFPGTNHFRIGAGIYTLTVAGDKSSMTITEIIPSVVVSPGFDEEDYIHAVLYGTEVTVSSNLDDLIHAINPNEVQANYWIRDVVEYLGQTQTGGTIIPGNQTSIVYPHRHDVTGYAYIGWIEPYDNEYYNYCPLWYIEDRHSSEYGEHIICDTLVGVWAAERILWAKDLGNRSLNFDENTKNLRDYGIDITHRQDAERGWDQSNWVMLDFTDYLNDLGITSDDDALTFLNQFVDQQLKPLSIWGRYTEDVSHRIEMYQPPVAMRDTVGYPGYMEDPLEALAHPEDGSTPVIYHYNHYTPSNFMGTSVVPFGPELTGFPGFDWEEELYEGSEELTCWLEFADWAKRQNHFEPIYDYDWEHPYSWTNDQWDEFYDLLDAWMEGTSDNAFFFVKAKVCEVAHVWGVWRGDDVFDVYTRTVTDDQVYNGYDLEGAFKVGGWEYNRLTATPANYGRPDGDRELHVNEAYEFHIAILRPGESIVWKKSNAPTPEAKGCSPLEDLYLIYPLDLISHSDAVTYIPGISDAVAGKTVQSVRYYNIMGQESTEMFDGINIVVTRYTDGTFSTTKVLR